MVHIIIGLLILSSSIYCSENKYNKNKWAEGGCEINKWKINFKFLNKDFPTLEQEKQQLESWISNKIEEDRQTQRRQEEERAKNEAIKAALKEAMQEDSN